MPSKATVTMAVRRHGHRYRHGVMPPFGTVAAAIGRAPADEQEGGGVSARLVDQERWQRCRVRSRWRRREAAALASAVAEKKRRMGIGEGRRGCQVGDLGLGMGMGNREEEESQDI